VIIVAGTKTGITIAEGVLERLVQHGGANIEEVLPSYSPPGAFVTRTAV
jgi:hypothetical protein